MSDEERDDIRVPVIGDSVLLTPRGARYLEKLETLVRYVAGIQVECCGKAAQPEFECVHDAARRLRDEA